MAAASGFMAASPEHIQKLVSTTTQMAIETCARGDVIVGAVVAVMTASDGEPSEVHWLVGSSLHSRFAGIPMAQFRRVAASSIVAGDDDAPVGPVQ